LFKKNSARKKSRQKKTTSLSVIITPKLLQVLHLPSPLSSSPALVLSDEQTAALKEYLKMATTNAEVKFKLLKALETLQKRTLQLTETKEVVTNLRESEETSTKALSFLKEKLDLLIEEREALIFKIATLQEELTSLPLSSCPEKILAFIKTIKFAETSSWEEELDYYRTRFLMQKDEDAPEIPAAQKISVEQALERPRDPLSISKTIRPVKPTKPSMSLLLSKTDAVVPSLVATYNQMVAALPENSSETLLELNEEELAAKLTEIEQTSMVTGKELYGLKREQGILSLKTYELIQTLKVRLFNISGAIASRSFLKSGLNELLAIARDDTLPEESKKQAVKQSLQRLLRILGEIPVKS